MLADSQLNREVVFGVTFAATGLILLNLFVPGLQMIDSLAVANRLIAVLALLVTGWLSDACGQLRQRNRRNEEAILKI